MCSFGVQNSLLPSPPKECVKPWAEGKPRERQVPSPLLKLCLCKERTGSFSQEYDCFLMNGLAKCTPLEDRRFRFELALSNKPTDIKQYSADFGVLGAGIGVNYKEYSEVPASSLCSQCWVQIPWKSSRWDTLMLMHLVRGRILARQLHYLSLHLWYIFASAQGTPKYMWSCRQPVKMCQAQTKKCIRATRTHLCSTV